MLVALKRNGIVLPKSFMHVMDDFKPRYGTASEGAVVRGFGVQDRS